MALSVEEPLEEAPLLVGPSEVKVLLDVVLKPGISRPMVHHLVQVVEVVMLGPLSPVLTVDWKEALGLTVLQEWMVECEVEDPKGP